MLHNEIPDLLSMEERQALIKVEATKLFDSIRANDQYIVAVIRDGECSVAGDISYENMNNLAAMLEEMA